MGVVIMMTSGKNKKNKNDTEPDAGRQQPLRVKEVGVRNAGHTAPDTGDKETGPYSDNQPNVNYGVGEEGIVNPNKP